MKIIKSRQVLYEQRKFDSDDEKNCYIVLRQFYPKHKIKCHTLKKLTDYPRKFSLNIDFVTPDFYVEFKGAWAFTNSAVKHGLKTKLFWFVNQYQDKPLLVVVNQRNTPTMQGLLVVQLSNLQEYLNDYLYKRNRNKSLW